MLIADLPLVINCSTDGRGWEVLAVVKTLVLLIKIILITTQNPRTIFQNHPRDFRSYKTI